MGGRGWAANRWRRRVRGGITRYTIRDGEQGAGVGGFSTGTWRRMCVSGVQKQIRGVLGYRCA